MAPKHPWKQHKQVAGLYRPTRKTGHTRYVIQPTRAFATRIGMLSIAQLIGMLKYKSFTFIYPKCLVQFALGTTVKEEQRRKLTPTVMTASFKNWSMFTENLALLKYCLCSNWWQRVVCSPCASNSEFLVNLDRFSKFLKYFKYFGKWFKLTKNSDFFVCGEHATLSHYFEAS